MGIPGPMSCPGVDISGPRSLGGNLWYQVPSGVGGCVGQWGRGLGRSRRGYLPPTTDT